MWPQLGTQSPIGTPSFQPLCRQQHTPRLFAQATVLVLVRTECCHQREGQVGLPGGVGAAVELPAREEAVAAVAVAVAVAVVVVVVVGAGGVGGGEGQP